MIQFKLDNYTLLMTKEDCIPVSIELDTVVAIQSICKPTTKNGTTLLNRRITKIIPTFIDSIDLNEDSVLVVGTFNDKENSNFTLEFKSNDSKVDFTFKNEKYDEIRWTINSNPLSAVYGFGEQFTHLNFQKQRFTLCVSEQGIGRGQQPISSLVNLVSPHSSGNAFTTYAPMPLFMTSDLFALVYDQNTIYHFDIGLSHSKQIQAQIHGAYFSGTIFIEKTPLELIEKMTEKTGRLKPLPDFAYDTVLGLRGGKEAVSKILNEALSYNTPVKALWIEDWQGKRGKNGGPPLWWKWFADETLYPDFKNWSIELKEKGIALLGYANPFLSLDETNPLYIHAKEHNYLVKGKNNKDLVQAFWTSPKYTYVQVDLTNPSAYLWLKNTMIEGMIQNGLSGWMADYGEYLPLDCKVHEPNTIKAHCELPLLWAKLNHEIVEETKNRTELLIFHRSAAMGSNHFATSYWAGDQNPTLDANDGLASAICGLISSGLSGMSINHTDIGGFTTIMTPIYKMVRKKEVMFRWLEVAAFTPIFRTHDGNFSNPLNYQFYYDTEGYEFFSYMANIHSNLKWYILLLQQDAVNLGIPMIRSLWLHYPDDLNCRDIKTQYLFGKDILVSAVLKENCSSHTIYVPDGEWIDVNHTLYQGGQIHTIHCPLKSLPILISNTSEYKTRLLESLQVK